MISAGAAFTNEERHHDALIASSDGLPCSRASFKNLPPHKSFSYDNAQPRSSASVENLHTRPREVPFQSCSPAIQNDLKVHQYIKLI
jgi:hypothetical protein